MSSVPHSQKTLTVMFTDIAGFTRHTGTATRDAMMKRLERHNALLLPIIAHFDGKIVKSIGDAFLVVFESPTNALQCGMLMQYRLRLHNERATEGERIDVKVSLNTGEVTVTQDDVFGDPVNVAAKIEKATQPGEIYFTEATFLAMNKAEVPNSFVKTFRPRGAESDEIKLFKVVQDEDDPVYRHVVADTKIDEVATKEKAAALATVAEREASRWQDALDHFEEGQKRMTRTIVTTVAIAVVLLGGAVFGAITLLGSRGGPDPERALVADARAFVAAGKVAEARKIVAAHVAAHGHSKAVDALATEIEDAACADACVKAKALLDEGKDVEAAAAIHAAHPGDDLPAVAKTWLSRASALGVARERLAAGDAAGAREQAKAAAGGEPPTGAVAATMKKADALDAARRALAAPEAERGHQALDAISAISQAYGDDTGDRVALSLLAQALAANLFAVAREDGPAVAKERLEEHRKRFKNLTEWAAIRRESDLGGLWAYASDPELRRHWHRYEYEDLTTLLRSLHDAAGKDAEFWFRLAATLHGVSEANSLAVLDGMEELEQAATLDPKVIERRDAEGFAMVKDWLQYDMPDGSFARKLAAERWLERLRPTLVEWLSAMSGEGADAPPDVARRANAFAVLSTPFLSGKGERPPVEDRAAFLSSVLPAFVEGGDHPSLTLAHAKALFSGPMTADERTRLDRLLENEADAVRNKEGRFGAMPKSVDVFEHLRDTLNEAQPQPPR